MQSYKLIVFRLRDLMSLNIFYCLTFFHTEFVTYFKSCLSLFVNILDDSVLRFWISLFLGMHKGISNNFSVLSDLCKHFMHFIVFLMLQVKMSDIKLFPSWVCSCLSSKLYNNWKNSKVSWCWVLFCWEENSRSM